MTWTSGLDDIMRRRYATIESEAALRELSELVYPESMIPIRAEDKFAFQLTFHGRNKMIKTSDPEILLLKHARYILENADQLKSNPDKREEIRHFNKESLIWESKEKEKAKLRGGKYVLIRGPSNSSNLNSKTHTVLRKRSTADRLDDE